MYTHVLFLAMSVLPEISKLIDAHTGHIKVGQYRHQDERKASAGAGTLSYNDKVYYGIGQLEPIPQLLNDSYKLTHIIILETTGAKEEMKPEDWGKFRTAYNKQYSEPLGEEPRSAVDFFKFRMKQLGINVSYIDIDYDENDPAPGIEDMLAKIRDLYSRCGTDDWKLWLDTHGGFRDCAMAMFALVQVLAAEDISGIPKLTDAQRLIPVTDVFGIRYRDDTKRGEVCPYPIVLQTDFYKNFTGEAFRAYMNYGQYLQSIIESCDPTKEKYTFISYRHGEVEKERVAFLGLMKKTGHAYWYDDGIKIHDDWAETLVRNNENCTAFALLLSPGYFNSAECLKELRYAIDNKGFDNILVVFLDRQARIDPSCDKKGVASDGKEYTVKADELARLGSAQQINLTGYSIGDVLQAPHLEKRLYEICFLPCKHVPKE